MNGFPCNVDERPYPWKAIDLSQMLVVVTDHHIERLDNIVQYRKAEPYPLVLGISDQFQ